MSPIVAFSNVSEAYSYQLVTVNIVAVPVRVLASGRAYGPR
jgi:hypothetical protein